jgi:hypothetical protein
MAEQANTEPQQQGTNAEQHRRLQRRGQDQHQEGRKSDQKADGCHAKWVEIPAQHIGRKREAYQASASQRGGQTGRLANA